MGLKDIQEENKPMTEHKRAAITIDDLKNFITVYGFGDIINTEPVNQKFEIEYVKADLKKLDEDSE